MEGVHIKYIMRTLVYSAHSSIFRTALHLPADIQRTAVFRLVERGGMGKLDSRKWIKLDSRKWIKLDHVFPRS